MRAPSVPLITHDPYFSVWSPSDTLNGAVTVHWTNSPVTINGTVTVDGKDHAIIGNANEKKAEQISLKISALLTEYEFICESIKVELCFCSPLLPDRLDILSRPLTFLTVKYTSLDGKKHDVSVKISVSEEVCINKRDEEAVVCDDGETATGVRYALIGSKAQNTLARSGDDLRINWGYFYLCGERDCEISSEKADGMEFVSISAVLNSDEKKTFAFAYDDIESVVYFGKKLKGCWKRDFSDMNDLISASFAQCGALLNASREFSDALRLRAFEKGGDKYAEMLSLSFRQFFAAHKAVYDEDGELLFISKECFSNGCAATVDITYPSSPLPLCFNTELLKGMLRPVFKYSASDMWKYDFAPHDVGTYPLVNGQKYGAESKSEEEYRSFQMPVEECGNILITMANICLKDGNTEFADKYADLLEKWVKYLEENGDDPENQLCTDDFAGHLAHNCNLSLKAISGIAGYGLILKMKQDSRYSYYLEKAKQMADSWLKRASNGDGSYKLAFDTENTFSMKYNAIWDKIWKTELFDSDFYKSEFDSYGSHMNKYGLPLDNRASYTKSDWLLWTACFAESKGSFESFIEPLWNAYNESKSRVPMTDWYDTVTADAIMFQHRSVIGGLFIGLML